MNRLKTILALARAEARLTRRLVRFWVFQTIALLIGVIIFLYYSWLHFSFSTYSATAAIINPRYLATFVGINFLTLFLVGLIFLGFDVRARDTRERMVEVLDALPCSNVELLLGKYLGILIASWVLQIVFAHSRLGARTNLCHSIIQWRPC